MSNIVDTFEGRIQNAILTAIDNIVALKIELAIRSINASSGRDMTNVTANSERGGHVGINASSENASGNNNILHVSNVYDETRHNIPEVSELSVPETHFDRNHTLITAMTLPWFLWTIYHKQITERSSIDSYRFWLKCEIDWNFEYQLLCKSFQTVRFLT